MDVKPWDDETDMKKLEEAVRSVEMPGLLWGACTFRLSIYNESKLYFIFVGQFSNGVFSSVNLLQQNWCQLVTGSRNSQLCSPLLMTSSPLTTSLKTFSPQSLTTSTSRVVTSLHSTRSRDFKPLLTKTYLISKFCFRLYRLLRCFFSSSKTSFMLQ